MLEEKNRVGNGPLFVPRLLYRNALPARNADKSFLHFAECMRIFQSAIVLAKKIPLSVTRSM